MKVLVIGSGGREHALVWKLKQSARVKEVICVPGNPGIAKEARCVNLDILKFDALLEFAKQEKIDLTVVGPEVPLTLGITDYFEKNGMKVFGPSKSAAELEGSKAFMKSVLKRHAIPTAEFKVFRDYEAALEFARQRTLPLVVKADGLCAGKGVVVCHSHDEADEAIRCIMKDRVFGDAGACVVLEDCLVGEEASILLFTDGRTLAIMESAQDHKAIFDGDKGPNTGGMGAYSPATVVSSRVLDQIEREVLVPIVHALNEEGRPYRGVLYAGIMITESGPKVLEFNCRFGDPECQPLLMRLKTDLFEILWATANGKLDQIGVIEWSEEPALSVVMSSAGYPGVFEKGKPISGIAEAEASGEIKVFCAGVAEKNGELVTNGGRVLNVTGMGKTIPEAQKKVYEAVEKIKFSGAYYRHDIADKAIRRKGTKS